MRRRAVISGWGLAALLGAVAIGCPSDDAGGIASDGSTASPSSTVGSSSTSSSSDTGEGADSSSEGSSTGQAKACDLFSNDCPAETKCMPVGEGTEWTGTTCAPLDPQPVAVGEPCQVSEQPKSGIDNCGAQAICWFVDPQTLAGECVAMCTSDTVDPGCNLACDTLCTIATTLAPPLCLAGCDPLAQDCPADRTCVAADTHFVCVRDDSGPGGAIGEPCMGLDQCDPGLFCLSNLAWPDCPGPGGCCAPACDLLAMDPCAGSPASVSCQAWYGQGTSPPSTECTPFEQIGVCALD